MIFSLREPIWCPGGCWYIDDSSIYKAGPADGYRGSDLDDREPGPGDPHRSHRRRGHAADPEPARAAQRLDAGDGAALQRTVRPGGARSTGASRSAHRRRAQLLPGHGHECARRGLIGCPPVADGPTAPAHPAHVLPEARGGGRQRSLRGHRLQPGADVRRPVRRTARQVRRRLQCPWAGGRGRCVLAPAPAGRLRQRRRPAAVLAPDHRDGGPGDGAGQPPGRAGGAAPDGARVRDRTGPIGQPVRDVPHQAAARRRPGEDLHREPGPRGRPAGHGEARPGLPRGRAQLHRTQTPGVRGAGGGPGPGIGAPGEVSS